MRYETDRLVLRDFTSNDFNDYFDYIMEPELQYMLGLNNVNDRQSALENFNWLMENRKFVAVENKEDNKVIGHIAVHPSYEKLKTDPELKEKSGVSLSFAVAKPYRRKGFMTEALKSLIENIFKDNSVDYIDCEYTSFNDASKELQEKLGFEYKYTEMFDNITMYINILKKD